MEAYLYFFFFYKHQFTVHYPVWFPYLAFHWRCFETDAAIDGLICFSAVNRSSNAITGTLWMVWWFNLSLLRICIIDASLHAIFKSAPVKPSLDSIKSWTCAMGQSRVTGSNWLIILERFSAFGRSTNTFRSNLRKNASSISLTCG